MHHILDIPTDSKLTFRTVQTVQPTASSKMMMSWLKTASPTKRKNPSEDTSAKGPEEKLEAVKQTKPAGTLQQWLLGTGSNKKPRT